MHCCTCGSCDPKVLPCGSGEPCGPGLCTLSRAHAGVKRRVVHASMLSLPTGLREVRGHGSSIEEREISVKENTHTETTHSQHTIYGIHYHTVLCTTVPSNYDYSYVYSMRSVGLPVPGTVHSGLFTAAVIIKPHSRFPTLHSPLQFLSRCYRTLEFQIRRVWKSSRR